LFVPRMLGRAGRIVGRSGGCIRCGMRDKDLYARILGVSAPWRVVDVELELGAGEVLVYVKHSGEAACPCCGRPCRRYDGRERRWRHLDTCQYRTILIADVPRVNCEEHGVRQIAVPWAEPGSGFTALFECLVIDWLKEASIAAVSRLLGVSWDEVDGIMGRAVQRGLLRRGGVEAAPRTGVDETSFAKRHEYVTVVTDLDTSEVLHVSDDRRTESLADYFGALSSEALSKIEVVSMDMWPAYIKATRRFVPDAKIAFDRFHVAQHLGDAVDQVRRREQKELRARGDNRLTGTRYLWLENPLAMSAERWEGEFASLRGGALRTARAWAIKETAAGLWAYRRRGWAERGWERWLSWASRCRLGPIQKAAAMIRKHLWGILNAVVHQATNAGSESINAKIQRIKRLACGFRNRTRFRNAIYFHLGGLDLYPATHTTS